MRSGVSLFNLEKAITINKFLNGNFIFLPGDTRIHSETSMERQERFKRFKKKGHFCSCFRSQGRICGKSAASTTSFTGTIYSVGSSVYGSEGECWRKEEDGKVPFDILDSLGKFTVRISFLIKRLNNHFIGKISMQVKSTISKLLLQTGRNSRTVLKSRTIRKRRLDQKQRRLSCFL